MTHAHSAAMFDLIIRGGDVIDRAPVVTREKVLQSQRQGTV